MAENNFIKHGSAPKAAKQRTDLLSRYWLARSMMFLCPFLVDQHKSGDFDLFGLELAQAPRGQACWLEAQGGDSSALQNSLFQDLPCINLLPPSIPKSLLYTFSLSLCSHTDTNFHPIIRHFTRNSQYYFTQYALSKRRECFQTIHFGFTHIHRCVLALYTRFSPELCVKITGILLCWYFIMSQIARTDETASAGETAGGKT